MKKTDEITNAEDPASNRNMTLTARKVAYISWTWNIYINK